MLHLSMIILILRDVVALQMLFSCACSICLAYSNFSSLLYSLSLSLSLRNGIASGRCTHLTKVLSPPSQALCVGASDTYTPSFVLNASHIVTSDISDRFKNLTAWDISKLLCSFLSRFFYSFLYSISLLTTFSFVFTVLSRCTFVFLLWS